MAAPSPSCSRSARRRSRRRPGAVELAGILTRSEGEFAEILGRSDLIVELIGGTDPARDYVLAALRGGKPVVTADKQLLAQHGDELFGAAARPESSFASRPLSPG